MIEKLEKFGISGKVLVWIKSWLYGRVQCTKFSDCLSSKINVGIGIPQGTALSCLLFNLYVNDLPLNMEECDSKQFADDTLIWAADFDIDEAIRKINSDMLRLDKYLKQNKLKINLEKTKCMLIGARRSCYVEIGGFTVEQVRTTKYLGVFIDDEMKFKENADFVCKKIAKKVGLLGRLQHKLDLDTKLLLYKTLIAPHIDYAATGCHDTIYKQ